MGFPSDVKQKRVMRWPSFNQSLYNFIIYVATKEDQMNNHFGKGLMAGLHAPYAYSAHHAVNLFW